MLAPTSQRHSAARPHFDALHLVPCTFVIVSTYAVDPAAGPTCRCRSALTPALFCARHRLHAVPITLFALTIHAAIPYAPRPRTPTMPRPPTIHRAGRRSRPRRGRARRRHVPSSASRVRRPCACPHRTSPRHHALPPVIGLPRCSSRSTPCVQALDRSASAMRCFPPRARVPPWQAVLAWHHHLPSPTTSLPRLVPAARAVCRISPPGTGSSASLAACRAVCSINLRP